MIKFTKAHSARATVKKATPTGLDALTRLRGFLEANEPQTIKWLVHFWNEQAQGLTYAELRTAILNGSLDWIRLDEWQNDYSRFVTDKLAPQWQKAFDVSSIRGVSPGVQAARDFIDAHGAEFVTVISNEQITALNALIGHAVTLDAFTPDELAHVIRPFVGLTKGQSIANLNYYTAVYQTLQENGAKIATAQKKARDASVRYAARQHRYRAQNIARTELAFAYNRGHFEAARQAQADGLLGAFVKRWATADDERMCSECEGLDGVRLDPDTPFVYKNRELYAGSHLTPPAHPSCRCTLVYEELAALSAKTA